MLDWKKINKIAVLGASAQPHKYGYKIMEVLMARGYELFPINLTGGEILGRKVYENIEEIIDEIDLLDVVIPPDLALKEIMKITALRPGLPIIVQQGAESPALIEWLRDKDFPVYYNACVMVVAENKK